MDNGNELTLTEIEQCYPDQWTLIEETAWDEQGNPARGIVRAHSANREDLSVILKEVHQRTRVKTFIFYTGDKIPEHLTVVL
jgi:hypothetical protein